MSNREGFHIFNVRSIFPAVRMLPLFKIFLVFAALAPIWAEDVGKLDESDPENPVGTGDADAEGQEEEQMWEIFNYSLPVM